MRRKSKRRAVLTDINVTPFVDVLLIVLIVFMVTAPLLNNGFDVTLPEGSNSQVNETQTEKLIVSVDVEGHVYIEETRYNLVSIEEKIKQYDPSNVHIYIQGDKDVVYQNIISVMSRIHSLGYGSISLITQPE